MGVGTEAGREPGRWGPVALTMPPGRQDGRCRGLGRALSTRVGLRDSSRPTETGAWVDQAPSPEEGKSWVIFAGNRVCV